MLFRSATAALSERAAKLEEIAPPLPAQVVAPIQESGLRRRRATPYKLDARLRSETGSCALLMANRSTERAAVFHVYDLKRLDQVPARHTVGAGQELAHVLPAADNALDIFVLGPNGFHRRLTGRSDIFSVSVEGGPGAATSLLFDNLTSAPQSVVMADLAYGAQPKTIELRAGTTQRIKLDLKNSHGWYDRQFSAGGQVWRVAGHIETGDGSYSDPAAGGIAPLYVAKPG